SPLLYTVLELKKVLAMRKIISICTLLLLVTAFSVKAQSNVAYVDSEYVLKHIPEYNSAITELDKLSDQWQKEVDARYEEIEKLYSAYQQDQPRLSEQLRQRRENEIIEREKQVKDFQRQKFGFEGDLFKERERLIKPIQDKVTSAIQAVANEGSIDLILDKNSETSFLFANPKFDKSNEVITKLGYSANSSLAN